MNLGKAIKLRLVEVSKSQDWLAKEMGTSTAYVSNIIRNEKAPSFMKLRFIAERLHIKLSKLIAMAEKYEVDE